MIATTTAGRVRGRHDDGIAAFKGIPYAQPPQGELRFQPPMPPLPWDGIRDCLEFGPAAPQLPPAPGVPPIWQPADGLDCLTLNVWTPDLAGELPVMVWIHGGLWKLGATRMPQYEATTLARSGVVVVTVNYRVGFEGFGHLPGTSDNRGLRDQIAALEWVRANVASFGGDPADVTAFGQSAGAASVALLTTTGLFRRAIAQSIPAGIRTRDEAAAVTATIAAAAGVEPTRDAFAALPPEAILRVQDTPLRGRDAGLTAFSPVIDGDLVTGPKITADPDVDLVCGYTHDEYLNQGPPSPPDVDLAVVAQAIGLKPAAADDYRRACPDADPFTTMLSDALIRIPTLEVAEAHAAAGGRTWLYDLAWPGPAGHGADVPLVFGDPGTRFAARVLGAPTPPGFDDLSARIRRAWTGFAATGDPGWPAYDLADRRTRIWDVPARDVPDPLAASRRIWLRAE